MPVLHSKEIYKEKMYISLMYPLFIDFCKSIHKFNKNKIFVLFTTEDSDFLCNLYENMFQKSKRHVDFDYLHYDNYSDYIEKFETIYKYRQKIILVNLEYDDRFKSDLLSKKLNMFNFVGNKINQNIYNFIDNKHFINHLKKSVFNNLKLSDIFINMNYEMKKEIKIIHDLFIKNTIYHENITYINSYVENIDRKFKVSETDCKYKGLVALDIDDTITNLKSNKSIKTLCKLCTNNNIKIIFVTARQIPFLCGSKLSQTLSTITDILNDISFDYNKNKLDIWYNPSTFLLKNVPETKYQNILSCLNKNNLDRNKAILFDDNVNTIDFCNNKKIKSVLVKQNKGIDENCLNIFINFFKFLD